MIDREAVRKLMAQIMEKQGKAGPLPDEAMLRDIGFRSLDFSELALRVELVTGVPLTFDAAPLRAIQTVEDVLNFIEDGYRTG